jgi:hydroxymethylbilane synthase
MIIGTRGSKLAIAQTEKLCERLRARGLKYELKTVQSLGDLITDRGLYEMPSEGVFVKKLDMLLLDGKIDLAVHSMKDIPLERDDRLETSAVLPRDSPYDVLVSRYRMDTMPEGANIGTSSVRRKYQVLNFVETKCGEAEVEAKAEAEVKVKVKIKDIRGNVDTRIKKFKRGEYDGVILAEAGLERLNIDIAYERLDYDPFVPSPGQGIIAIVTRKGSAESEMVSSMDDADTRVEADVEKEVLKVLGGGCSLPVGVHARCKGETVELAVYIGFSDETYLLEKAVLGKDRCLEEARAFIEGFGKVWQLPHNR